MTGQKVGQVISEQVLTVTGAKTDTKVFGDAESSRSSSPEGQYSVRAECHPGIRLQAIETSSAYYKHKGLLEPTGI